jgi:hypothetical protein
MKHPLPPPSHAFTEGKAEGEARDKAEGTAHGWRCASIERLRWLAPRPVSSNRPRNHALRLLRARQPVDTRAKSSLLGCGSS